MRVRPLAVAAVLALGAGSGLVATPASAAETDAATAVADVAIVLPLTVPITDPAVPYSDPKSIPVATPTLMDAETLAYYTSPTGILTSELDAVYDSEVTIAIDPLIIASIRALGSQAPESARAWLSRLSSVTNDTFALSWADSDMTAPLQAGRRRVVQPTSLDFAIDPTRFAVVSTAAPDPSDTATPDPTAAPPLPTGDALTAWNYTLPSIAWPQADTVGPSDFKTIARTYSQTLLSSGNVKRATTTSATASVSSHPAIVVDAALSQLVATALNAADDGAWNKAVDAANTSIAATAARVPTLTTASSSPATLVVALDRTAALTTGRLAATVSGIAGSANARLVGLGDIASGTAQGATGSTAPTASLIDERQPDAHLAAVKKLLAEESVDARFSGVADNPALITGERRIRLLNALSPSTARQTGGAAAAMAEYLADSTTLLQSVRLARSSGIVLLGDTESIRRAVINDLGQPVTVYLEVRSPSPNLKVQKSRVELKIEPNYQRTASVPVQAISNGEVSIGVRLRTRDGVVIGRPEAVSITVRAGWEGPFTLIGGIVVVLVFAAGIARTVVRRRKARATAAAGD